MSNNVLRNVTVLANAIVVQACDDYRMAIRGNCSDPDKMLREVKMFFKSGWYKELTNLKSAILLRMLDEEWIEGRKLIEAGRNVDCPELRKAYEFECPICGKTAEAKVIRSKRKNRKDGSYNVSYFKTFTCKCHIPEQILLKQEVIPNESNEN